MDNQAAKTPLEDLRRDALKHYEEASSAVHHWSSFVVDAIKNYDPDPQTTNGVVTNSPTESVIAEKLIKIHFEKDEEWICWMDAFGKGSCYGLGKTKEEAYKSFKDDLYDFLDLIKDEQATGGRIRR